MTTEHVVHFRIHGVDMTRMIHDLLFEGSAAKAYRVASGLIGEGAEAAALQLLRGTHRLAGRSDVGKGMRLVETTPTQRAEFDKKLAWTYAGRMQIGERWWRPVAWIDSYGPEDLHNDHGREVRTRDRGAFGGYINRAWHYAGPEEIVLSARTPEGVPWRMRPSEEDDFIFEPCGERPHWMTPCRDASEALAEWHAVERGLNHRGWMAWYGSQPSATARAIRNVLTAPGENEDDAAADAAASEDRRAREIELTLLRDRILAQAGDDLFDFAHGDRSFRIPRAPFLHWALDRTGAKHMAPPWTPVSSSGMKLPMDDPCHTDWMIGGGFNLQEDYVDVDLCGALLDARFKMARNYTETECGLLVGGPYARAKTFHPRPGEAAPPGAIVVLPNLQPQWLESIVDAAAVITEAGGVGAHLSQIGRERRLPIVVVKDARVRFPPGTVVSVDSDVPEVCIHDAG